MMGYAWKNYRDGVIRYIAEILEREYGNPNHKVVAEEIFDALHPEATPAVRSSFQTTKVNESD